MTRITHRVSFVLGDGLHKRMREAANSFGVTDSEFLRFILLQFLNDKKNIEPPEPENAQGG